MFNLEIINQGTQFNQTIELNQIVTKPLETLQYSKYIDDRSVALDYFESVEINSEDHLEINDLSWKIIQNNPNFFHEEKEFTTESLNISSSYKDLLITNIILKADKEGFEQPIWYRHKRTNIKEADLHYLSNGDSIDVNEGFLIKDGFAYTNYTNTFDNKNANYRVYFISGILEDNTPFNELLNVVPAIGKTTYRDIDLNTGEVISNSYELIENGETYDYHINLKGSHCQDDNTSKKFYVKAKDSNLINLVKPDVFSMANPWLLRVTNGFFFGRGGKKYWVPEYYEQPFDGMVGALRLFNKECRFVTESIIKLPVDNILIDPPELIHISIHIYDEEENILAAYTTNPNIIGLKYSDSDVIYVNDILSWDEEFGFVELNKSINASNIIKADFYYRADTLILSELDVNLFNNQELVYNKLFFYLVPNKALRQKSVFYFILDEEDRIIQSSNPHFKTLDIFGSVNDFNVIGKGIEVFRNAYCVGYGSSNHDYLELGEVTFKEDYYLDKTTSFNVRSTNYLKSSTTTDYFNAQHKALQSKFGYGKDGQVVQKNNLIYVKYPIDLLEAYGGDYQEADLKRYTKRKMRPGMDLVVEYYYPKSTLTLDTSTTTQITVNASWEGPGTYSILRSLGEHSERVIIHTAQADSPQAITYIDNNLVSGNIYWYWVRVNSYPESNSYGVEVR